MRGDNAHATPYVDMAWNFRGDRHSDDDVTKMVVFRDPERSVLKVREHRKRGEPPFAGRQR
jgi:hypothetical protein